MASRSVDLLIAYRIIKLLVTPFNRQEAFKTGIIDDKGKVLKKMKDLTTEKERSSYTMLHRFIFNLKRILQKFGLGSKVGSFAVAMGLLLKEDKTFQQHQSLIESTLVKYLKENKDFDMPVINEEVFKQDILPEGNYKVNYDVIDEVGNIVANKNDIVVTERSIKPVNTLFGIDLYEVVHSQTGKIFTINGDNLTNA
tara:strand:- start:665 stop:1255 length:591 start_codon:yes stop_codon:yes gene_type:complete